MINLKESKEFLIKAIKSLPKKDKVSSIRISMNRILNEMELIESKSKKTETNVRNFEKEWKEKAEKIASMITSNNALASINVIDKLIDEENKKISDIENSKNKSNDLLND